ncbi:Crp/Fnr family transcriptional regulator [Myxosarcina sp. GI1(2024)]
MMPVYVHSTNHLLKSLPPIEYKRLEPCLNIVQLPLDKVLYEASETIEYIYFPNTALISSIYTLENGATSEISLIGRMGLIGLPVLLGSERSNYRAVVQTAGSAVKISARIIKREFERGGELQKMLLRYTKTRLDRVAQLAICNRHHTIEKRLACWLLMVSDLTQSNQIYLTQEFISNMLGVRRPGITITARTFQQAGIISYRRSRITIVNREKLKRTACECYQPFHEKFYKQKLNRHSSLLTEELSVS